MISKSKPGLASHAAKEMAKATERAWKKYHTRRRK